MWSLQQDQVRSGGCGGGRVQVIIRKTTFSNEMLAPRPRPQKQTIKEPSCNVSL